MNLKSRDPGLSTPAVTKRDKSSMEVRNRKKRVVGLSGSTGEHGLDFDDLVDRKHQPEGDSKKSKVSGKAVDTEVTPESTTEKKRSAAKPLNQGWADWQRDSADTVRIIAALIIWAAMSFLFFIAQGNWFLDLTCSSLIIASTFGILGSIHGITLGSMFILVFRTGLVFISVLVVLCITLLTFTSSFDEEYGGARCGDKYKTWRRTHFCTDDMSESHCEEQCRSTVGKDLRIEMISCSALVSALTLYCAYAVYDAEKSLYPRSKGSESNGQSMSPRGAGHSGTADSESQLQDP
ncbi:hypothetical protein AAMO2058_001270400 [Amorphochlora amoebiformis]